jgi:hypothetical protein
VSERAVKFKSSDDKLSFCVETDHLDLLDTDIPLHEVETFLKRRRGLTRRLVDFRRSQNQKHNWRTKRYTYMRGIRHWHKSTEGKRFHRNLARFLVTHLRRERLSDSLEKQQEAHQDTELLKALSSVCTHLYIELDYYLPLDEEVEWTTLLEYAIPLLRSIESKCYTGQVADLEADEIELLCRLTNIHEVYGALSSLSATTTPVLKDTHQTIMRQYFADGKSWDDTSFCSQVFAQLVTKAFGALS